jgi:hypothetical protein
VAEDVAAQRKHIVSLLDAIDKPIWMTSLANNQSYTDGTSALQSLQTQIASWGLLGPALGLLAKTLSSVWSEVDGTQMIPPTSSPQEPEIIKQARDLLVGHVIGGVDIDPLRKNAADAVTLATTWGNVNRRAKDVTAILVQMQARTDLSTAQKDILATVKDQLVAVWKHLWEAPALSDLATLSATGSDLDSAEVSLARIASAEQAPLVSAFSLDRALLFTPHRLAFVSPFTALSDINNLPANDDRRLALLTRAIRYGDSGSAILAFVIALLTGLNMNYFPKPFGTLQDYVVLFLWGAGTKVTLDIFTSVLDRFSASLSRGATPS